MTTDDTQRILDWCSADDGVRFVEERSGTGAGSTLVLESGGAELTATLGQGDRMDLRSVIDLGGASRPGRGGDLAAALIDLEERRPGPVTAELDPDGEHASVATWIVRDGLTKHSFLAAVSEITRTRGAVLRLAGLAVETPAADAEREPGGVGEPGAAEAETEEEPVAGTPAATPDEEAPTPSPWEVPAASAIESTPAAEAETEEEAVAETPPATSEEEAPVPSTWEVPAASAFVSAPAAEAETEDGPVAETPPATSPSRQPWAAPGGYGSTPSPLGPMQPFSAGAAGQGQGYAQVYGQTSTPATSPAPAQQTFTFTPTHRVPPQGMQAWAAPDPAGAVIATLGGHLPVQVTEVRGAWAHVLCSNGWTGWVDDRLLIVGA